MWLKFAYIYFYQTLSIIRLNQIKLEKNIKSNQIYVFKGFCKSNIILSYIN